MTPDAFDGPPTPISVCRWLADMDDPTSELGQFERENTTLETIIQAAQQALDHHHEHRTPPHKTRRVWRNPTTGQDEHGPWQPCPTCAPAKPPQLGTCNCGGYPPHIARAHPPLPQWTQETP